MLDLCLVNTRHRVQKKANAPQTVAVFGVQGSNIKASRLTTVSPIYIYREREGARPQYRGLKNEKRVQNF